MLPEEIIMKMESPDFIKICQLNKTFHKLCNNQHFWHKMYNKYYGDSGMKQLLTNIEYDELFKICYNLHFIQITFVDGISLTDLYNSHDISISGDVNLKFLTALGYMHHLEEINFSISDFTKVIYIPRIINDLPLLKKITYQK